MNFFKSYWFWKFKFDKDLIKYNYFELLNHFNYYIELQINVLVYYIGLLK